VKRFVLTSLCVELASAIEGLVDDRPIVGRVVLKERKLSSEGFLLIFLIDGGLELERDGLLD
jgi:hypothetical protein